MFLPSFSVGKSMDKKRKIKETKMKEANKKKYAWAALGMIIAGAAAGTIFIAAVKNRVSDENSEEANAEGMQISTEEGSGPGEGSEGERTKLENTLMEMRPALAALRDEGGNTMGSGFILELKENEIYICTNRHVIEDYDNWEVEFFDGTKAVGIKEGISQVYDVGIVRVKTADIPERLQRQLFAVEVDLNCWKELNGQQLEVGFVSMYQDQPPINW